MKYTLTNNNQFKNIVSKNRDMYRQLLTDNASLYYGYYDLKLSEEEIYSLYEKIEHWESDTQSESFEEIERNGLDKELREGVVRYVLAEMFLEVEIFYLSMLFDIDKRVLENSLSTFNLIILDHNFKTMDLLKSKEEIKYSVEKCFQRNNEKDSRRTYEVVFNVEKVSDKEYLISPFITTHINEDEIKVPRLLDGSREVKEKIKETRNESLEYTKGKFYLEDIGVVEGYTKGGERNGYSLPLFELSTAKDIVENFNEATKDHIEYNEDEETFEYKGKDKKITPTTIEYRGEEIKCYNLNNYYWNWQKV
jgi:hypothetical protein